MKNPKEMVICRCEEVRLEELEAAIEDGATTSQELKLKTRAGMGTCQGRICRLLLECLAEEQEEGLLTNASRLTIHYPVRPVYLGQIKKGGLK